MATPAERVALRHLQRKAAADPKVVKATRLADLMVLYTAFEAYQAWLAERGDDPGPLAKKGAVLIKRFAPQMQEALQQHIKPLQDRQDATPIKPAIRKGLRAGAPLVQARRQTAMIRVVMGWLKSRQAAMRDIFTGRSYKSALQLAVSARGDDSPVAILHRMATVPFCSGVTAPRNWIREAAREAGVSPDIIEELLADADTGNAIAMELKTVREKLESTDPTDPSYPDLQGQQLELVGKLRELADASPDASVVVGSAVSAVSSEPVSKIGKKAGLNDEQMAAMLAEGRILITAGAGAGKTRVMAAKVAWFVEEKGVNPAQILATSFTNKSAKELKERVAEEYGIVDAAIGTTHRIAKNIIMDYRPQKREEMFKAMKGSAIAMLFKLAVEQVKLAESSGGGYGGGYGGGGGSSYRRRRWADDGEEKTAATEKTAGTPYWKQAVGEWFNLGQPPVDNRGRPVGLRRLKTAVGIFKAHNISVQRAWQDNSAQQNGSVMYFAAAVYGAYEWLKSNDPQYGPAMDFDDWLTEAVDILRNDKRAREALQRRFKVVLVDEAQDLNMVQHELFALIAEKADTYAMVGDDKQAIYAFRGAVPEEFTAKPGQGFETHTLTMNFRSGVNIVEAANKLIAHNEDRQIPMTCKADEARKGMGQIRAIELPRHEDCAVLAAGEISGEIKEGGASPSDFGVLVRNNAESDAFCLALMAKGIPFRSKANFFTKPAVRAMVSWMTVGDTTASESDVNDAVAVAHRTPGFFLNYAFEAGLRQSCPPGSTYLEFLVGGGGPYSGRDEWRNRKMVAPYAQVLREITSLQGVDTETLMRGILDIQGSKESFMDSLMDQVDPEDIAEQNETLEVTDEMIREAALSPLKPLLEMAKKFNDPSKFMQFIRKMERANDKSRKDDDNPEPAVMVDTIHQWKGLQAKQVYTVMAAGTFPHKSTDDAYQAGDDTAYDDERRLAYVALTRGEDSVTVLCPDQNYMGMDAGPSRFVSEACIGFEGEDTPEEDADAVEDSSTTMTASVEAEDHLFQVGRSGDSLLTEWGDDNPTDQLSFLWDRV